MLLLSHLRYLRGAAAIAILTVGVATCQAQLGRWQLGNPSLIVSLPGDPSGGGVAWNDGAVSFLPTSWSAENADLRVEIAERYSTDSPSQVAAWLGTKLGSAPTAGQDCAVSGMAGYQFKVGNAYGLTVSQEGRAWLIVARPKTSAGNALADQVMSSILVERWGAPRWVRRSLGNLRMNASLPYELAAKASADAQRREYEVHFSDFGVIASVASPGEGMKIDVDGTIKDLIAREKARSDPKAFSVKQERMKDGTLITMTIKTGTKTYAFTSFIGLDNGHLLRLDLNGIQGNSQHEAWTHQIVDSLRVSSVNFVNFSPRQLGTEGVWFDGPKEFTGPREASGAKRYDMFPGSFEVNARVQTLPPGVQQNIDQFMGIEEAVLKPRGEVRDYETNIERKFVDGIEARVLHIQYREKDRKDRTLRKAIVLFLPDRTVTAEMIANEEQSAYLDRIVETARVTLPLPAGWTRHEMGESRLSFIFGKMDEAKNPPPRYGAEKMISNTFGDDDLFGEFDEFKFSGTPPSPGVFVATMFQVLKNTFNTTGRIVEQRPFTAGNREGVLCSLEFDHPKVGKLPMDLIILRKGNFLTSILITPVPGKADALTKRTVLINSLN